MGVVAMIQTGFNNGEVSPYMYGRVDDKKYSMSVRECTNMRPLVQGPATKRDGTRFVLPVADETQASRLFKFEFSPTQGYVIEMNDTLARFFTNRGVVLETAQAVTAISQASPAVVTSAGHGYANGDQVLFPAVGPYDALKNRTFTVAGKTTDTFQLAEFDGTDLPDFSGSPTVARIYSVATPYSATDLKAVTSLHSADVLTLMHGSYQPRKLTRNGATDWSLDSFVFKDGPYLTEDTQETLLTPAGSGNPIPIMTSNTAPSGTVSDTHAGTDAYVCFDGDINVNVILTTGALGALTYDFGSGVTKVIDAYSLVAPSDKYPDDTPTTWTIEASNDGSTWVVLDSRQGETGFASSERRYYDFLNQTAYRYWKFHFQGGGGSDTRDSRITELTFHENGDFQTPFSLTASATDGINDGDGFQDTDVGRCLRLMGSDDRWRWARITSVVSTTEVKIRLYGQALINLSPIRRWRLGLFSDTSGWPTCGAYHEDRQVFSGPPAYPNIVCFSTSGVYDTFTPSEEDGTVTDASGFAYTLLEQQVTGINWIQSVERGLIVGTPEGEALIAPANAGSTAASALSAHNIRVTWPTNYGSAAVQPANADTALLFVDRQGRRVREMTYQLAQDTFVAPDMNARADHITVGGIVRSAFMRHPERHLWSARADGRLLGFTYERGEDVTAWHSHALGGSGKVEACGVISAPDGKSEDLWLEVQHTINGVDRRFIEYIGDWFTHDTDQADACFVDAALVYDGDPVTTVSGLAHLEGATVRVLADGMQIADLVVANGTITLPRSASTIIVGLPYTARLWLLRPEGGAQNGTAQGKLKRVINYVLRLYRSLGGSIGDGASHTETLNYWSINNSFMRALSLFSGDTPRRAWPGGYEQDGGAVIENDTAYPFTVLAYMPQLDTKDA
jgi:hypothetical protein